MKRIKLITFSKNRPVQLYAMLESLYQNCLGLELVDEYVLFKADDEYRDIYSEVEKDFPNVKFIEEKGFFTDLSKLLLFNKQQYLMFLVDDIIFKGKFWFDDCLHILETDEKCFTFSLRLGRGLDFCYPISLPQKEPSFISKEEILTFTHDGCDGDWGYPISLDGNIFRTEEFNELALIKAHAPFHSPNSLESSLYLNRGLLKDRQTACFEHSVLLNIPDNRVQSEIPNKTIGNDPSRFVKAWQDGLKIDISKIQGLNNNSCHFPIELELIKR